jgi:hypothetical protein
MVVRDPADNRKTKTKNKRRLLFLIKIYLKKKAGILHTH